MLGSHLSFSGIPFGGNWATILVGWWASLGLVGVIEWVVVSWVGVFLVILDWLGPDGLLGELWAKGGPVVCCALGACMDL